MFSVSVCWFGTVWLTDEERFGLRLIGPRALRSLLVGIKDSNGSVRREVEATLLAMNSEEVIR